MSALNFIINPKVPRGAMASVNKIVSSTKRGFKGLEKGGTKAYTQIHRKTKNVLKRQRRLNDSVNKGSGLFRKLATGVAAYFGARTVFSGIDLASEVAENNNKLDAVFRSTSGAVRDTMGVMSKDLKMGEVQLQRDFANVGAVLGGLGFSGDKLVKNTENILKAGYDAASFHNLSFERSIGAIQKAMLGESEALKQATGIIVQDQTMSEYSDQLGIVWKDLKNAEKAQLRLNYIMGQMKKQGAVGDLLKTQDQFENTKKSILSTAETIKANFFTALQEQLLPGLIKTRDYLIENKDQIAAYGEALGGAVKFISKHRKALGVLAGVFATYKAIMSTALVVQKTKDIWTATKSIPILFKNNLVLIKNIALLGASKVAMAATAVAQGAMTAAQWALNAALNANPISLIIMGIGALITGLVVAYKKSETFRNIVNGLWDLFINNPLAEFVAMGLGKIGSLVESFGGLGSIIKSVFSFLIDSNPIVFFVRSSIKSIQFLIDKLQPLIDKASAIKNIWPFGKKDDDSSESEPGSGGTSSIGKVAGGFFNLGKGIFNAGADLIKNTKSSVGSIINSSSVSQDTTNNIIGSSAKTNNQIIIPVSNNVDSRKLSGVIEKKAREGVEEYNRQQLAAIGG